MLNKSRDVLYCGCNIDKIKQAKPVLDSDLLDLYVSYQKERTNIYYKKEVLKQKPPYTDQSYLRDYRFTNTRRELDKESKILIENVLNKDISNKNKLMNSIFCRSFYSKAYPLNLLEQKYIDFENINNSDYYNYLLKTLPESSSRVYLCSGFIRGCRWELEKDKIEFKNSLDAVLKQLHRYTDHYYESFWDIESPIELMKKIKNLGNFLKYQVFVDMTYLSEYPFSENEFVLSGPGCTIGINLLVQDLDGLTPEEFMFWFRDNISILRPDFNPEEMFFFLEPEDRNWGVMQIENSFCEFQKLLKVYNKDKPTGKIIKRKTEMFNENDWA